MGNSSSSPQLTRDTGKNNSLGKAYRNVESFMTTRNDLKGIKEDTKLVQQLDRLQKRRKDVQLMENPQSILGNLERDRSRLLGYNRRNAYDTKKTQQYLMNRGDNGAKYMQDMTDFEGERIKKDFGKTFKKMSRSEFKEIVSKKPCDKFVSGAEWKHNLCKAIVGYVDGKTKFLEKDKKENRSKKKNNLGVSGVPYSDTARLNSLTQAEQDRLQDSISRLDQLRQEKIKERMQERGVRDADTQEAKKEAAANFIANKMAARARGISGRNLDQMLAAAPAAASQNS